MIARQFASPLVRSLIGLTLVTGAVDAVSFLFLGRVFVANMTGNVVFVGFAIAGAAGLSAWVCLTAVGGFSVGSLAGGRLARALEQDRRRWLAVAVGAETLLVAAALLLSAAGGLHASGGVGRYAAVLLLAVAMGIQNATARALAVPDLTTTVLTLTLTGLTADSALGTGKRTPPWRRIASVTAMLTGAIAGGALVLHASVTAALGLAAAILAIVGVFVSTLSAARLADTAP
ncbi:MAG TPA: YoaK family protein [Gaiellaceae bacterium]|nr:YoaK family protein [Gaiellaceae bacterium]